MTPSEFREDLSTQKTRMNGLSCGEESMTIYSAVLIGCQRVTDRRTDGRTDGQTDRRTDVKPIAITCFSIADARKKNSIGHSGRLLLLQWSEGKILFRERWKMASARAYNGSLGAEPPAVSRGRIPLK